MHPTLLLTPGSVELSGAQIGMSGLHPRLLQGAEACTCPMYVSFREGRLLVGSYLTIVPYSISFGTSNLPQKPLEDQ